MEQDQNFQVGEKSIAAIAASIQQGIDRVMFGQEEASTLLIAALVIGGHVLLEGPPGVGKTVISKTFADTIGMRFRRIQFTPDLMPSDITGVNVFDQQTSSFRFVPGPLLADVVLADEINRTPPKTQSALLEAMEERMVTIDGTAHDLGDMFFVMATQNPVEHEGTYPLPEAQLDRFLFRAEVSYPSEEQERRMISRFASELPDALRSREAGIVSSSNQVRASNTFVTLQDLRSARLRVREVKLEASVLNYLEQLILSSRKHPDIVLGISPRAGLHLALAAKFFAALDERDYVLPDDIKRAAKPVLAHRLIIHPHRLNEKGLAPDLLPELLAKIPVPDRKEIE